MATPPPVQTFLDAARSYVRRALHVELDGSEASLAFVDHYITITPKPLADDVLALVAPALGAYLGEVAIARLGGAWILDGDDPAAWRVELEPVELRFYPVGMAAAALRGEEVDGYDASFATRPELMGPLAQALAAAPPVDEAYFYSLTGRFETLVHAVEILVELARQKKERDEQPPPDDDDDDE
jgi:hypothetical protein